jgi:two-component system, cell cycle sensor histidine kinase and response regulator CckA
MADRFYELIHALHIGVVVQGPSTEVLVCNPASLELLGLDEDQYRGKTSYDPDWNIVREDGSPFEPSQRPMARVLATALPVRNVVMGVYRPKTRDRVWLLVDAQPELDDKGRVIQVVSTLIDITMRKHLESSLAEARKLESIGRLAGGIAHDFNNLLTVITGATSLAMMMLPVDGPIHDELEVSLEAAGRAAALTRQLLAFARRRDVATTVSRVADVVVSIETLVTRVLGVHIGLQLRTHPDTWSTQMAPVEIEQILVNLAANARDAMPSGGTLTISTSNLVVTGDWDRVPAGEYVLLLVSDTGEGMSPETRERIFEPFFTTKDVGKGTGLGLATVHGVVQQHGGFVTVDSAIGVGTTFTIYLRRAQFEEAIIDSPLPIKVRGRETILVAEDEEVLRKLARRILEGLGYKVLTANDGVDALKVAAEYPGIIDILFTDLTMPEMNGELLANALIAQRANLRILITSGFATADRLPRDKWHVLDKPYSPAQLASRLREVLDAEQLS